MYEPAAREPLRPREKARLFFLMVRASSNPRGQCSHSWPEAPVQIPYSLQKVGGQFRLLTLGWPPKLECVQSGLEQTKLEQIIMFGDSRVGSACGIAYRITVIVSLAAMPGRVLHGVEGLRCPAYGCVPAASGCRRCRACATPLRAAHRAREDSRNV